MNGRRRARRHNDEWLPRGTTQPTKRYHGFTATLSLCDLWRDARAANDGSASPSRTVATIYRTRWHGRNPSNRTMVSPGTLKYMYDNYANPRIIGVSRRLLNGLSIESTCKAPMMVTQTRHNFVWEIRIFSVKIRINPYPSYMHQCIAKTFTRFISRCSFCKKNRDIV